MITAILIAAIIILLCVLFNKLSSKMGVPMLLAFIVLGMLFGKDGLFKIDFEDYAFAEKICSIALIFIMFYGGFGTKWSEAKSIAGKAALLSTLGVVLTAALTGLFCYFALRFSLLESFLIGAVISSTDAASVFSILRSKKLGLKYNTSSMLEMESGSNDPCSYMLTAVVLSLMSGKASAGSVAYMVFAQFAYGIAIGAAIALGASLVLKRFKFGSAGFDMVFVIGIALLSYALPSMLGGNGYLSAYIVGIVLGNSKIHGKKSLVHFLDGLTGMMQMIIFFLLGLLATPSHMPAIFVPAVLIALFLTIVARPAAVFAILSPSKCKVPQQLLVSFSGLRGAASIVFAIMALVSDAYMKHDLFHIVFCIVLLSILFQGSLIPPVARKLGMIDEELDVLKTFNDYSEEVDLQFIKLAITEKHPWRDKAVRDLILPPDTLLVLVLRGMKTIVPDGNTMLWKDDVVVLSAPAFTDDVAIGLKEQKINRKSRWTGKDIAEYSPEAGGLVILIKRGDETIIPRGDTKICENDVLVINETGRR